MKLGRKLWLTVLGLVVLVAIIPLMKWAMGGQLPEGFAIPWLTALVALITGFSVTNVASKAKTNERERIKNGQTRGVPS